MTLEEKRALYRLLLQEYQPGEPCLMAKMSNYLAQNGVHSTDYGYVKAKAMYLDCPEFARVDDIYIGEYLHPMVTLLAWEQEDAPQTMDEHAVAIAPQLDAQDEAGTAAHEKDSVHVLSAQDKRAVYHMLCEKFPQNEQLHMASVSAVLRENGMTYERFGYAKMKPFLYAMSEFLDFEEKTMGGVPQTLITIRSMPQWDAQEPATQEDAIAQAQLPACIDGFVFLPFKPLAILNKLMTGQDQAPPQSVIDTLKRSYAQAYQERKLRSEENSFSFETELRDQHGNMIEAAIRKTTYGELPWFLSYVGSNRTGQNNVPGKMLEQFAFLGSWQSFLKVLADMALPEPWDFGEQDGERREYFILQKYIQYTFYRLTLEDKVLESEDGTFAAFNTGLVTAHYDDIYACFEASDGDHATKWRFLEFCTKGRRGTGKRLVDYFNPLPQPASYFERKEDLLFDLEKDLHTDYDHILLDNVSRLPIAFLQEECRGFADALVCIRRVQQAWGVERKQAFRALAQCIDEDPMLFNRLRNRVADAIELAKKQVRWNFKAAIPCYFPTRNTMSLMLPLSLRGDGRADVALVVELMRSGNYQGQTILTLQQAYIDGRLLCRPNSDWLDTRIVRVEDDTAHDETDNF